MKRFDRKKAYYYDSRIINNFLKLILIIKQCCGVADNIDERVDNYSQQ